MALPHRHQRFVDAYVGPAGFNATEAARRAGYKGDRHALAVRGAELLRKPPIQVTLRRSAESAGADREQVLALLARHMNGNMADFLTTKGPVKLDLEKARAAGKLGLIKSLRQKRRQIGRSKMGKGPVVEEMTISVELYNAQDAAGTLAKIMGLYREKADPEVRVEVSADRIIERLLQLGIPTEKWPPGLVRRYEARQREQAKPSAAGNGL
jgi:hypothetical protein